MIDRREFAARVLEFGAMFALPASSLAAEEAGPCDVVVRRDIRVRMRDGVVLATDVYLPARGFDFNPNTGESDGKATHTRVATNRVFLDRQRPSHVVLPLIPIRG